jgi:hypothetical protein
MRVGLKWPIVGNFLTTELIIRFYKMVINNLPVPVAARSKA